MGRMTGAYPTYQMDIEGAFPRVKATGAWSWQVTST